jgi:hypothetical protein
MEEQITIFRASPILLILTPLAAGRAHEKHLLVV